MPRISLFITPGERERIIRDLAKARGLRALLTDQAGQLACDPVRPPPGYVARLPRAYSTDLYPADLVLPQPFSWRAAAPGLCGWITVRMGRLGDLAGVRYLEMTEIATREAAGLPYSPSAWLRTLRRQLHKTLAFGVEGVASDGASAWYGDIGYSEAARSLYEEGVAWRQVPEGTVQFRPRPRLSSADRP